MLKILPIEVIDIIFSFIKKEKCYRCGKDIPLLSTKIINKVYCSIDCLEYQHY
jgi:hypothetical protein